MPQLEKHQLEAQRAAGLREPKMHVRYTLRLGADEHGVHKYYVGSSCHWMNRIHNHIMGNDRSSAWVKKWKYEELVETRHCHDRLSALCTEVGLTVQYKAKSAGTMCAALRTRTPGVHDAHSHSIGSLLMRA